MSVRDPRAAAETVRVAIRKLLSGRALTALEISGQVGIPHKAVDEHLEHLQRSSAHRGERFVVEAASCLGCHYEFNDRQRLGRPSRCPKCKGERIDPPRFRIEAA